MKVNLICLLAIVLTTSFLCATESSGQGIATKKIALSSSKGTLKAALKELEITSGLTVFYPTEIVDQYKEIRLNIKPRTIGETLDLLLAGTILEYKQTEENIVLSVKQIKKEEQELRISGIVQDPDGKPLSGVTILVESKNTGSSLNNSTATDRQGHWGLVVSSDNLLIRFQYLGYKTVVKSVKEIQNSGVIVLEMSQDNLDEVVVIGYGTTTKRLNTGSVSSITAKDIEKQTVANPIHALAGRIAGVEMVQNNGLPGSNSTVRIRGVNNLGSYGLSGGLPLFIVDGTPFTNFNTTQPVNDNLNNNGLTGANGGLSVFSSINPADIERIDVLKDADATAIYGARGANGVILITTKKGKSGKSQFNVNLQQGAAKVGRFVDMLNTQQYLEMRKEAFVNDGVTPTTSNAPDLLLWDQNGYTDWQKEFIGGTANITDAQLNYQGGNDRFRFFTSGAYRNDGTVFKGDMGNTRLSGRMSVSTNSADKRFSSTFSVNYTNENTDLITTDVANVLTLPPNYPLYKDDGQLYWIDGMTNPMSNLLKTYDSSMANFIATGDLKYRIITGLNLKLNVGYTRNNLEQVTKNPLPSQNPFNKTSHSASFANIKATNYIAEPQLEYTFKKGKGAFLALVGGTFQQNISDGTRLNGTNYTYEAQLSNISAAGDLTASNAYSEYKYASLFGKVNYDYANKYIVNGTFRRDASSRFGPNRQFANFAALGAAWIFTEEGFLKENLDVLSFGKLRASYGTTGNDQLPNYSYMSLYRNSPIYQKLATLSMSGIANPDLEWETTKKMEFGIDLGFFNDRILLKTAAYWHNSGNLLTYASAPHQTGFNSVNINLDAVVQNKGLEIELNTINVQSENFRWSTDFNISFQKNKMTSFNDKDVSFYGTSFVVGESVPPTFKYRFDGIDPTTGKVLIGDLDGNPNLVSMNDRYITGVGTPYYGGMNNSFSYKGLSFDFFLQFNHRRGTTNQINGTRIGSLNNQNVSALDRWRQSGDTGTLFPGASANPGGAIYSSYQYFGSSDFFYGNASFLKLRSASLSYTLPQAWNQKIRTSNTRLYVQGQNLLTFAKNKYLLDPESGNATPPLRAIIVGLNVTF
ncbi:MAG: SusC/RagA family TonB-linked outer membrane protein [Sphingobacterium sp.]|nr:SusC/RagA family TonB-linked outer membrane protein [Sphingobacterium sp.]